MGTKSLICLSDMLGKFRAGKIQKRAENSILFKKLKSFLKIKNLFLKV